ncbi:hypothetical protein, partial [Mesorhizobium sp. M1396]|uniref:hypothetical protein n=1 Tax=Mesorhizobium sp. M1396 TaxID=2957095 RepID=UPI003334CA04
MAWLQQQLTRERPDTFMQLESSSAMSRTLARTGRTIHLLGTACADLIMAWLQQQLTRERPDTFM